MPATPDRTTIKAAIENLTALLRANLAADPPTVSKPFRRIEAGRAGVSQYPRPFMVLYIKQSNSVGVTDNDKIFEVTMGLVIVCDVTASDPHGAVLDKIGAVEDYFDGIVETGLLEGAEGFDNRVWSFDYPKATAGARVAAATANQSFIAKVQRQQNREPAS